MYNTFTDYINQIENNTTVTNQPNWSNDWTFNLNTTTKSVLTLSRLSLAAPNVADTYSLSSIINFPFKTTTSLNATGNPSQTLYQLHIANIVGPSASLP